MRRVAWMLALAGCILSGQVTAQDIAARAAAAQKRAVSYEEWYARNAAAIQQRHELVQQVMQSLHADLVRIGASTEDTVRLQQMLHGMSTPVLEAATALTSVSAVESAARGGQDALPTSVRASVQEKLLGDLNQDLVFVPHGP